MSNDNLYAVIIAGGSGKRFWPLSREARPKQLIPLNGEKSLLRQTVDRILPLIPRERIVIVAGAAHSDGLLAVVPDIPQKNIIIEPEGKNSAPAVAIAAAHLLDKDKSAVMAVLPADHLIGREDKYIANTITAAEIAVKDKKLVTFGIRPTKPETGYGYLEIGEKIGDSIFNVKSFKEKPNRKKAKFYLESGRYFWNSGMFVFTADLFVDKVKEHMPDLYSIWAIYANSKKSENDLNKYYSSAESVSVDYGIMEKSGGSTAVVAASFSWSDVGSWDAIDDIWEADDKGNRHSGGETVFMKSQDNTVLSKKLVAMLGVEGIIVVETDDAIMICKKDRSQELKELVDEIEKLGYTDYL